MPNTRGDLAPAKIFEVADPNKLVECMFNPHEYKITKQNAFKEQDLAQSQPTPSAELQQAGVQTLQLKLFFDTYEAEARDTKKKDVSLITRQLWEFMNPKGEVKARKANKKKAGDKGRKWDKGKVPQVCFQWGVFSFNSYITSMTQNFTLFLESGVPVRAEVDITFKQYSDVEDYNGSANGLKDAINAFAPKIRNTENQLSVIAGDRLDEIAYSQFGDPSKWREIAEHNKLTDPSKLIPGSKIKIPSLF